MLQRGSYFFVIDSFVAGLIVVTALLTIVSSYSEGAVAPRSLSGLEDAMSYMRDTSVGEFSGNETQDMVAKGNISDRSTTLFGQVAKFHQSNDTVLAAKLLNEVVRVSFPPQLSVRYTYNETLLYNRTRIPKNDTNLFLSTQRVSLVTLNRTSIYGPHPVKLEVWAS